MSASISRSAIEKVLNHCLSLDPYAGPQLLALSGKVVELALLDSDLAVHVRFMSNRVQIHSATPEVSADACLSGTIPAFIHMAAGIRQTPRVFASALSIRGDIEVVQQLKVLMSELDIDWEEQLSRWLGDSAAHGIGLALRAFHGWGRQTTKVFWMDLGEYLTEEKHLIACADEVKDYLERVDDIRDDVERLIARVARLG